MPQLTELQTYAVMVMVAGDVDAIWHQLSEGDGSGVGNPIVPDAGTPNGNQVGYVNSTNFEALAQVRCDDSIITKSINTYYGLLLKATALCPPPFAEGDLVMAVRGTMDGLEWMNNVLAEFPKSVPGQVGQVSAGFWDVYDSMSLNDLNGNLISVGAASGLATLIGSTAATTNSTSVYVVGHSLGAALATYLTAELEAALARTNLQLKPYFFASPRTGTADFVANYQATVSQYSLVNYARDLVPQVPTAPPAATLLAGGPTHDVHIIPVNAFGAPPNPDFVTGARLAHNPAYYAVMLDSSNVIARNLLPPLDLPALPSPATANAGH